MKDKNIVEDKKAQSSANPLQQINQVISELEDDPDMVKEVEALHKIFMKVSKTITKSK
jgi:hypothetical protein